MIEVKFNLKNGPFCILTFAEFQQNAQGCLIFSENEIKSGGL